MCSSRMRVWCWWGGKRGARTCWCECNLPQTIPNRLRIQPKRPQASAHMCTKVKYSTHETYTHKPQYAFELTLADNAQTRHYTPTEIQRTLRKPSPQEHSQFGVDRSVGPVYCSSCFLSVSIRSPASARACMCQRAHAHMYARAHTHTHSRSVSVPSIKVHACQAKPDARKTIP